MLIKAHRLVIFMWIKEQLKKRGNYEKDISLLVGQKPNKKFL